MMGWLRKVGVYLGLIEEWMPQLGELVVYNSKTGNYRLAAIVNCTWETIDPRGVELGHVPPLTGPYHVHLTVFTPGKAGTSRVATTGMGGGTATATITSAGGAGGPAPIKSNNVAGCYQEWDIPIGAGPGHYRPV
jgi:hypothetical protein